MKSTQRMIVAGLFTAFALVLTSCGTDPESSNPTSSPGAGGAEVECGGKNPLSAEGSSAQKNAMDIFVQQYRNACANQQVNYTPSGSGAGIKQFIANQVDFAGSDSPLAPGAETGAAKVRCEGADAWNLPLVVGPIALAYHLDGVDNLVLTPDVTAKIFNGGITNWSDPAIKAVPGNENVTLPNKPIQVVSRSDESGTTDNFQRYLTAAAKDSWTQGVGKQFKGGIGNGAEKSNGVVTAVKDTDGAITYVEAAFAKDGVKAAQLNTGAGPVALTPDNVTASLDGAKTVSESGNDLALDLDSVYANSKRGVYPLLLVTYEIVCSKYSNVEAAKSLKAFLTVAATDGQKPLIDKGYVAIPQSLQERVLTSVKAINA